MTTSAQEHEHNVPSARGHMRGESLKFTAANKVPGGAYGLAKISELKTREREL